jgi:hypothetical protein
MLLDETKLKSAVVSYIMRSFKNSNGEESHDKALLEAFMKHYGVDKFNNRLNAFVKQTASYDVLEYKAKPWDKKTIMSGIAIFRDTKQPSNETVILDVIDNHEIPESISEIVGEVFKSRILTGFLYCNFNVMSKYYNDEGAITQFPIKYGNRYYVVVDTDYKVHFVREFYVETAFPELSEDEQYIFYVSYRDLDDRNNHFSLLGVDELFDYPLATK